LLFLSMAKKHVAIAAVCLSTGCLCAPSTVQVAGAAPDKKIDSHITIAPPPLASLKPANKKRALSTAQNQKLQASPATETIKAHQNVARQSAILLTGPYNFGALGSRAASHLVLHEYVKAGNDCEKALGVRPDQPQASEVARSLYKVYLRELEKEKNKDTTKDHDKDKDKNADNALRFLSLTIRACPNDASLYSERAKLYRQLGKIELAKQDEIEAAKLSKPKK